MRDHETAPFPSSCWIVFLSIRLFVAGIALVTGNVQGQTTTPGNPQVGSTAAGRVSPALLEAIWLEHLWLQTDLVRDEPRSVERYARKILAFKPADREALKRLIRAARARGELQWAMTMVEWLDVLDPTDPEKRFLMTQLHLALADTTLRGRPTDIRVEVLEGQVADAITAGDRVALRDMEDQLREMLAAQEGLPSVYRLLGQTLAALEEHTLAAAAWRKAARLEPARYEATRAYLAAMEAAKKAEHVDDALTLSGGFGLEDTEHNRFVGELLLRNQHAWKAVPWLARWSSLSPKNDLAWDTLARALAEIGEDQQARACWVYAATHSDAPAPYLKRLALFAAKEKNVPETMAWVLKLRAALPETEWATFLLNDAFSAVPEIFYLLDP
jgi:tetratricopeptide (TPR) repeat protein